jgi:hypothetical protein
VEGGGYRVKMNLPPEGEATIWDLVEARALGVSQLLELHGFFEARVVQDDIVVAQIELILADAETSPFRRMGF